jgi:molybdopterin converting factor small subunit
MEKINFNIILFGQLKDIAGSSQVTIAGTANTDGLKKALTLKYPELAKAKYVIAVNRKIVLGNIDLDEKSEIALLPPFSGG